MSDEAFMMMRAKWVDHANGSSLLTHVQSRIAIFIALRTNAIKRHSYWSVGNIAKALDCSTKSVSDTTTLLEDLKLLHVVRSKRGGNKYFIRWPFGYDVVATRLNDVVSTYE